MEMHIRKLLGVVVISALFLSSCDSSTNSTKDTIQRQRQEFELRFSAEGDSNHQATISYHLVFPSDSESHELRNEALPWEAERSITVEPGDFFSTTIGVYSPYSDVVLKIERKNTEGNFTIVRSVTVPKGTADPDDILTYSVDNR